MYYALYTLALISLSQASVIIRWSQTNPLLLGSWRLLFAGLVLWGWSRVNLPPARLSQNDLRKIIAAGFAFFVHLFSYAYAAHHTSISHLMLIFSLNPVTTAFGSWIFFNERMTRRQVWAYLLALIGIYLLAREKQGSVQLTGDLMAIVAAVTFSAYALLSQWARRDLANSVFASRMYLAGSAFFFLATLLMGVSPLPTATHGWVGILLLTLFPTLMGHGVFTLCMRHIPLPVLSLGKLIEPAIAAVSAFLLFGETLSTAAVVSFLVIVSAVVLVIKERY
jgi:drug/metabolite transporter (DMT)-like permease